MENKLKIIFIGLIFLITPFISQASVLDFNIDPGYDYAGRSKISAFLHQLGNKAYFYVEDDYYQTLDMEQRKKFTSDLKNLSQEFDENIYPKLTQAFGSEYKPGIDQDEKITVLICQIKGDVGGYFNSGDEYPMSQSEKSNEREMVYLNVNYIGDELFKSFLAHEFVHLITFNQKTKKQGIEEEIWLNEARAEYAPTFLGYDALYKDSNLQKRVRTFIRNPNDSLCEWKNLSVDYGVLNLFTQYLVDHYGIEILVDSLHSNKVGIPSLDYALVKQGYSEDFFQIFTDWTIAVLINDCDVNKRYCYLNPNLKNLKITPQLNYLPLTGESTLSFTDYTKDWSGNWLKFIGGKGTLQIEFISDKDVKFRVPYLIEDFLGNYSVSFLDLEEKQRDIIYIQEFTKKNISLTIIPCIQNKIIGFNGLEPFYKFILSASITNENSEKEAEEEALLIQELLVQIEQLKAEIVRLKAQINAILSAKEAELLCQKFENNLYYGMRDNDEVRCLQEFLKNQEPEIYPEGLITGNFLSLTKNAVIRFQEKYKLEILEPLGLEQGTGYVGQLTLQVLNKLIHK